MIRTHGVSQYSINKSKLFLGFVGPHWEQHIVAELDSALNEWIDTVPNHRAYFFPKHLAYSLNAPASQMGHNGTEFQRARLVLTVRKPLQPLLSPANSRASPIHTITAEAVSVIIPIPCDLH